jgi:hypothetical protein
MIIPADGTPLIVSHARTPLRQAKTYAASRSDIARFSLAAISSAVGAPSVFVEPA